MYIDKELELSDAQAITTDAASTNYIDLQRAGDRSYLDAWLVVRVHTAFDSAADGGTLIVTVQTDNDSAFGSATTLWTSATFAQATLVAGYIILRMRLSEIGTLERYLRVYYDNGTEEFTAGNIDAYITTDIEFEY